MKEQEFSGSFRLHDHVDGVDLFAGVRIWTTPTEFGISMNDGNGGAAESIVFESRWALFVIEQTLALLRRKAYRRKRENAKPNFRPLLRDRKHDDQVLCTECDHSGYVSTPGKLVKCDRCKGSGWMDPDWLRRSLSPQLPTTTERSI